MERLKLILSFFLPSSSTALISNSPHHQLHSSLPSSSTVLIHQLHLSSTAIIINCSYHHLPPSSTALIINSPHQLLKAGSQMALNFRRKIQTLSPMLISDMPTWISCLSSKKAFWIRNLDMANRQWNNLDVEDDHSAIWRRRLGRRFQKSEFEIWLQKLL